MQFPRTHTLICVAACLAGCPADPPPPAAVEDVDEGEARAYLLGARAESYDVTSSSPRVFDLTALEITVPVEIVADGDSGDAVDASPRTADDSEEPPTEEIMPLEAIVVPFDLLGVPWDSFDGPGEEPTDIPQPWVDAFEAMASAATETGLPLVAALSPMTATWDALAPLPDGDAATLELDPLWRPYCYNPDADENPARYRDAYARYTAWVAEAVEVDWMVLGSRLNRYEENCGPDAYNALVGFTTAAHERVSALPGAPTTIVSVDVEDLYGFPAQPGRCEGGAPETCLAERGALLAEIQADRLGLESYPAWALAEGVAWTSDWLDRVADLRPDLPSLVVGTGLPSVEISNKESICVPLIQSSENDQNLWLANVIATAIGREMELVIWTWLKDAGPSTALTGCSCSAPPELCQHLAELGPAASLFRIRATSGLWSDEDTPRSAAGLWENQRAP